MTPYRFDNKTRKKVASLTQIGAMLLGLAVTGIILFTVASSALQAIARGPQWFQQAVQDSLSSTAMSMITPKKTLIAHIGALESRIEEYEAQLVELQLLREENKSLREQWVYTKNPSQTILAGILAKPSQSLYNSLIIDRGELEGVVVGQLVTFQGSVGLGRVASVSAHTATVSLFSGPQFDGNLVIKGQNITVPAQGKGGSFEIHIPREIVVSDGDILVFPEYPDIAVAIVKSIIFDARDPFQTVLARTPVNVQELRFVEVVK